MQLGIQDRGSWRRTRGGGGGGTQVWMTTDCQTTAQSRTVLSHTQWFLWDIPKMKIPLRHSHPTLFSFGALNCSFHYITMCVVHALLIWRILKHLEPLHVMSLILSPGTRGAVLGLLLYSFRAVPEGYEISLGIGECQNSGAVNSLSLILSPGTRGAVLGLLLCSFWAVPEGYEISLGIGERQNSGAVNSFWGEKKGGGQVKTKNIMGALAYNLCLYSLYFIRYMAFFI